jgi:hypothetical protein
MSPMRRDAEGRRQVGPTWESLVERRLREAAEAGEFDDLPYRGERVQVDDDGTEWALAHHILRQAHVAPAWIETDKRIRELLERRDELVARAAGAGRLGHRRRREELARLVSEVNRSCSGSSWRRRRARRSEGRWIRTPSSPGSRR